MYIVWLQSFWLGFYFDTNDSSLETYKTDSISSKTELLPVELMSLMEMDATFIYLFLLFYHDLYKFNFTDCGKISKLHQASWYFGMDSRLVKTFKMTEKNMSCRISHLPPI